MCVCVCVCVCGFILNNCQHRRRRSEVPGTLETPLWVTNDIIQINETGSYLANGAKMCESLLDYIRSL